MSLVSGDLQINLRNNPTNKTSDHIHNSHRIVGREQESGLCIHLTTVGIVCSEMPK